MSLTNKARLHDSHFGYGRTARSKFWHANPRFLVRLMRLHEIFVSSKIFGFGTLNWERHSYIQSQNLDLIVDIWY